MYALVEAMRSRLGDSVLVVGYGHVGDGNLHLNVSAPKHDASLLARIEPFVYEWTRDVRGSISAEHGLGLMKAGAVGYSKSPDAIGLMRGVKQLFDPNGAAAARVCSSLATLRCAFSCATAGIMNPYKVLPPVGAEVPP
jgi:D-2-hydroxyglutarate dehydrogenase